nr:MAG TPA_asm: hypothetical protein [Bacteriophage sp.]
MLCIFRLSLVSHNFILSSAEFEDYTRFTTNVI